MSSQETVSPLLLVVSSRLEIYPLIQRTAELALRKLDIECTFRFMGQPAVALARASGGGVKLVLLDGSDPELAGQFPELLPKFRHAAAGTPVAVWLDATGETPDPCWEQMRIPALGADLDEFAALLAQSMLGPELQPGPEPRVRRGGPAATVITFSGFSGGAGVTTVAMNVAASLTRRGSTILAEIRPNFGGLRYFFYPGNHVRGYSVQSAGVQTIDGLPGMASLWRPPTVAGLQVLFGPNGFADVGELSAHHADELMKDLASLADFVVVDAPALFSPSFQAIVENSHYLSLILHPVRPAIDLAQSALAALCALPVSVPSLSAVLNKVSPDATYLSHMDVESALQIPVLKVIPPSGHSCLAAARSRTPIVFADPDSLAGESMDSLARCFHAGKPSLLLHEAS
jgi:MinD-like ATPase involved in chromosome partitioning or flagellar assembly